MDKKYRNIIIGVIIIIAISLVAIIMNIKINVGFAPNDNKFFSANVSATTTTLAAGTSKVVLKPASARKYAVLTNVGATIAYLGFNSTTTTSGLASLTDKEFVIPLAANGGSYIINPDNLYFGQVVATSSAAVEIRAMNAY